MPAPDHTVAWSGAGIVVTRTPGSGVRAGAEDYTS